MVYLEKIYKQDIFDTYVPEIKRAVKKSFITPIPEPSPPPVTPAPEPIKQAFIDPLSIKISGIISSSKEEKSIAMIVDETNKEKLYYLGDKVKDGQIIKIARNKIIILRSNGQQETFLLRKEDIPKAVGPEKWKYVVKKVDDSTYEIDPTEFALKINTLGELIEDLSLATAYQKGQPIGIKVGKVGKDEIGSAIGLNGNDIILSVNNVITSDMKNRVKIYDTLSQTKKGDIIKIVLKRKNQDITLSYK